MHIYQKEKRQRYLEDHPITHLFSTTVEDGVEVHEYRQGEWIVQEGSRPYYLFYVIEGNAKIYVTHQNGKVSLLNFIRPHDFIGEMELLNDVYYTKGIQATTKTVCFALPFQRFREQLLEDVTFLQELTKFLSLKATKMAAKYSQSRSFPLENRLAEFILQTADQGIYKEKHVTVCEFLGVSYRHLLHVLAQFSEKGYVKKEGRFYRIEQDDALKCLAEELSNR